MTAAPHARYEELVAGFALSALEPEDEQDLVRHLPACAACERELAVHRATLAQLAYGVDDAAPPAALWQAIRRDVVAESGPEAFTGGAAPASAPEVADLQAHRSRRLDQPRVRRAAAWTSVAAALALVVSLGVVRLTDLQQDRDQQGRLSDRLTAAVQAVETGPARTVPLLAKDGRVNAVAVVQSDRLSLIVDGLPRNDPGSSVYVLWGQSGPEPARALGTFDVLDSDLHVVRDLTLGPPGAPDPQLFVVTQEQGRTAPDVSRQPAVATGRAA